MRSIALLPVACMLVLLGTGCRGGDFVADAGARDGGAGRDGAARDGASRDGAARDGAAPDGAMRDDGGPGGGSDTDGAFRLDARWGDVGLEDGSLFGDADTIDGSTGPDGSLGCTLDSCGSGFTCCEDDGSCQPTDCPACCARRPDGGIREDASLPRADSGFIGDDAGPVDREDGGPIFSLDDGSVGPGGCGSVVCDLGTFCCPRSGICVPTDCRECCEGGGPVPPPEPPPPPPGF